MAEFGFPVDEYTPHGYLANPYAVAHSWSEGEGGCLRSSRYHVGFGWQLPWALRAQASVDLVVSLEGDGQQLVTRADFDAAGLISPHHSANLFVYRWQAFGQTWEAAYTLVDRGALGLQVTWRPWSEAADSAERPPEKTEPRQTRLTIELVGGRTAIRPSNGDAPSAGSPSISGPSPMSEALGWIYLHEPYGRCQLYIDTGGFRQGGVADGQPRLDLVTDGGDAREWRATVNAAIEIGEAPTGSVWAIARRVGTPPPRNPETNPHPNPLPEGEGAGRGASLAPALLPLSAPPPASGQARGLGGEVFSECPWFGTSSSACCS